MSLLTKGRKLTKHFFSSLQTKPQKSHFYMSDLGKKIYRKTNTEIKSKIKSATLGKLSIDNIKQLKINFPTLPEQVEIVRILDIIIEKENKAKQAAEAVLEQIDLLKKSILARAFRGEL